jgi:hypothetical protein
MSNLKGRPKNTTGQATTITDKELRQVESIIASGKHSIRNGVGA